MKEYKVRYHNKLHTVQADCARSAASIIARENGEYNISRSFGGPANGYACITVFREDASKHARVYFYRVNRS